MVMTHIKTLHPDAKGRIALGALAKGISSFEVLEDKDGRIILEPRVEIPAREQWLFKNKTAMRQVQKGLKDAVKGKISQRDEFK
jgi:hypothetical protein